MPEGIIIPALPKTDSIALFCKKFHGIQYCMHHLNPTYAKDCTKTRQKKRADSIRKLGYEFVRLVPVTYGTRATAYVIYARSR